jgi:hypothetical protein
MPFVEHTSIFADMTFRSSTCPNLSTEIGSVNVEHNSIFADMTFRSSTCPSLSTEIGSVNLHCVEIIGP